MYSYFPISFEITKYRVDQKSCNGKKEIQYLHYDLIKRTHFFTNDRGMFALQIHIDKVSKNLLLSILT